MPFAAEEFRKIVERHQSMVFSIALRITGDPGTAEEVAQDAFVALYRNLKPLQTEGLQDEHIRFWLRKVVTQRSLDAVRRRKRQPEMQADEWNEDHHGMLRRKAAGVLKEYVRE